ncbi:MAG: acyl-CoA reductase [Bacteroidetes bacterium]|nr:acyl-CoA reductase [Bacteroidota bacterium]
MNIENRINLLAATGNVLKRNLENGELDDLFFRVKNQNAWFTEQNVELALNSVVNEFFNKEKLTAWISEYDVNTSNKTVAIVMAGNIPLVGIHDLVCVFVAGYNAQVKLSSKDQVLFNFIFSIMKDLEPDLEQFIQFEEKLSGFDAVLATGSDNSKRYFEQYFGKVPNIIRGNRNSIALISGNETDAELELLASDIFNYFGMGCRSVNNLILTGNSSLEKVISHFEKYNFVQDHHKYFNNYEYYKSIFLVNSEPHLDNGFCLFRPNYQSLVSPVSVVNYHNISSLESIQDFIETFSNSLQCTVENGSLGLSELRFGDTQKPSLIDYADKIDVVKFLSNLN